MGLWPDLSPLTGQKRPAKRKRAPGRIGGRWPVRGLKSGQSPTGTSELLDRYRALTVTALAFPKPDARLFFPPRSFIGSCQTPVKKMILAEPSGGGLRCVPSFSALKTMTSPIFVSQYYN